ncbi:MAG: hypothetical protein SFU91_06685 [Chloroherpetonaceae bacterium]|nr:hypothetical protein [Chloroherpetonaceae bacterium]
MSHNYYLPSDLSSLISDEKIDFFVYPNRQKPTYEYLKVITFFIIWLIICGMITFVILSPLINGESVTIYFNDRAYTGDSNNLIPVIVSLIIPITFFIGGAGVLIYNINQMMQKGGIFVGTITRLIHSHKGKIKVYSWREFLGVLEIDAEEGDVSLKLRTGTVQKQNGSKVFLHDIVHI